MPEVRSGQVNCRERQWLRSGAPLSISPIPFDWMASAQKKAPGGAGAVSTRAIWTGVKT